MYYKLLIINIFFKILGGFKVKTNNYKHLSLILVLAIFAFITQDAMGQNLVNMGTGKILNGGTIRFVDNGGEFQNLNTNTALTGEAYDAETTPNSGTIEFQGSDNLFTGASELGADPAADANRISGWVIYNSASVQNIQARAYRNLAMAGAGNKTFGDAALDYFVDRIYTATGAHTRNYTGSKFYYDGDVNGAEDQTIFAESGASAATDRYDNLYFTNTGVKTLTTGETNAVETLLDVDDKAYLVINGIMNSYGLTNTILGGALFEGQIDVSGTGAQFNTYDGLGTFAGTMYIHTDGLFATDEVGAAAGALQTFTGPVYVGDFAVGTTGAPGSARATWRARGIRWVSGRWSSPRCSVAPAALK